ncbi:MAG: hypothetical protein Q7V88_02535 [Actinomycetota bacterium]|nr:hypothetical protein [Actinomycetota bacterium]
MLLSLAGEWHTDRTGANARLHPIRYIPYILYIRCIQQGTTLMAKLPTFPSLDLSRLDLSRIDLGALDDRLVAAARDAAYVTVGFGVLAVQQVQVRRRELVKSLGDRVGTSRSQADELRTTLEARMAKLDQRFDALEAKLDSTVSKVEERLPEQAAALVGQAHDLAKAARKQVRGLIRPAA